jgi:phosphotransferase system enzyme I (PtsI)
MRAASPRWAAARAFRLLARLPGSISREGSRGVKPQARMRKFQGIAVSPGIQILPAKIHDPGRPVVPRALVPRSQVKREQKRLEEAIAQARQDLLDLREKVTQTLDDAHAAIFDPQLMILEDADLLGRAIQRIEERQENAALAFMSVIQLDIDRFVSVAGDFIASRKHDILDAAHRVCRVLADPNQSVTALQFQENVLILAPDLSPSDTAQMDHKHVRGFATELGGPTSHTAILAKALEIPAVVGIGPFIGDVQAGDTIVLDGYEGTVTINPNAREVARARQRHRRHLVHERELKKLRDLPAETLDGYRVELMANIELPIEAPHVFTHGAEGVGLYRTEFQYLESKGLPTEKQLFDVYKKVAQDLAPLPVTFRTVDLGGDKLYNNVNVGRELNPFLGMRAIRLCLAYPEIFRSQLRAMLRASAFGNTRIMFPLISNLREIHQAKAILSEIKDDLRREGIPFDEDILVGSMIEIPSAAICADQIAKEVDFFSIGTNDLIQYTLAVDRGNEQVASLYDPFNPAILRLIRTTIDAAQREGIHVALCGEMSADPLCVLMLIGMGIHELSMGALWVPEIKRLIRQITLEDARRVAEDLCSLNSSAEIHAYVDQAYRQLKRKRRVGPSPMHAGAPPGKR